MSCASGFAAERSRKLEKEEAAPGSGIWESHVKVPRRAILTVHFHIHSPELASSFKNKEQFSF